MGLAEDVIVLPCRSEHLQGVGCADELVIDIEGLWMHGRFVFALPGSRLAE
jgi:hypothetical protein